jgi:N-acetylglutamate synthase-like GNAT family acetyltransferase
MSVKAEVSVRLATRADIPALEALIARSALGLSVPFYSDQQAQSAVQHVFGVDSRLVDDGTYYLLEADGLAVACGGWSRRDTLYGGDHRKAGLDRLLDPATEPARIRAFFVDPAMARRGLGRRLLAVCADAATASGFHALELVATLPGEPLYAALGFTVVERFDLLMPDDVRLPLARMRREGMR